MYKKGRLSVQVNHYRVSQWFPTFLVSWTLLTIWPKAMDPPNKTN